MNNKDKKFKFSVRKYKTGTASILLGTCLALGIANGNEAKAAEEKNEETTLAPKTAASENKKSETESQTNNGETSAPAPIDNKVETDVVENENTKENIQSQPLTQETAPAENKEAAGQEVSNSKDDKKENISATPRSTQASEKTADETNIPVEENKQNIAEDQTDQSSDSTEHKIYIDGKTPMLEEDPSPNKPLKKETIQEGKDISVKVTIKKGEIESKDVVNPQQGERVTLKYKWEFGNGINPGDYFDFTISNNVNTNGVSVIKKVPDIKNGSITMATGKIMENGKIRYTFLDYIQNKVNVTANLSLNLFLDPKIVKNDGEQTITSTLNGHSTSKTIKVKHLNGISQAGIEVNGVLETLDKENNKFMHIGVVNPKRYTIHHATINGKVLKGAPTSKKQASVKIYEYTGKETLPQSLSADFSNVNLFKDVSTDLKIELFDNGEYRISSDKLDKTYVIKYEGSYQNDAEDLIFRTTFSGYSPLYPYNPFYAYASWDNGLVLYQNNANGDGKNGPIIDNNDINWQEDTLPDGESGHNNGETEEEDSKPIEWDEHTVPDGESGHNNGDTEEEDSNPIDYEEDTIPDGENGHNNGDTEEEDSNPIDYEEDTIPDGENGHNNGDTEEEDSNPIDYEEDTIPDGENGHNNGDTEEEDSNPIDYEEDTIPDGEEGHNNGETEEEDSSPIDYEENTIPDGEKDHNNGETEEEDSNPINHDESNIPDDKGDHNNGKTEQDSNSKIIDKEQPKTQDHQNTITTNKIEMPKAQPLNSDKKLSIKPLSASTHKTEKNNEKLPETGQENNNISIFGALLAMLGAVFMFRRQKNKQ